MLLLFHQLVIDKAISQPLKPFYYYSMSRYQTNGITSQLSALFPLVVLFIQLITNMDTKTINAH